MHLQEIVTRTPVVVPEVHGIDMDIFDGMEAELTPLHIEEGNMRKCEECPVALCLQEWLNAHKEQIGRQLKAVVGKWNAAFIDTEREQTVLAATAVGLLEEWITDFDDGKTLPPGKVYIERSHIVEDDSGKHQLWRIGIDVPDAYYVDEVGDDNRVNWGV